MTSRETWKRAEREAAKKLGGTRIPCSGNGGIKGDVLDDTLFIEVKYREKVSVYPWMKKAIEQAEDKIPVLVLRQKRTHGELIVLRLSDFVELLGGELGGDENQKS